MSLISAWTRSAEFDNSGLSLDLVLLDGVSAFSSLEASGLGADMIGELSELIPVAGLFRINEDS